MESFEVQSYVRGHHIYQSVWKPRIGQSLQCEHEQGNLKGPYAIAILDNTCRYIKTVGHLLRKISAACSVFLRKGGHITYIVIAHRRYSADLPQGGLEVPCSLKFNGKQEEIGKLKKHFLLQQQNLEVSEQLAKKAKIENNGAAEDIVPVTNSALLWI